jgi:hypothetical protein
MDPSFTRFCPIVVTSCTSRKRGPAPPLSLSDISHPADLSSLASRWLNLLGKATQRIAAGDLYVGRSISESKWVAEKIGASMYVVSAGLGLVDSATMVPNYDLTISSRGTPLSDTLRRHGLEGASWWSLLTNHPNTEGSLAKMLSSRPNRVVFLALPASYLRMVSEDLAAVPEKAARRLRIFTSEVGKNAVPAHLRECVLPYDERLESLGGYDGTRAEFPQRALRHFVEELAAHKLALADAHVAVAAALEGLGRRTTPIRQRRTDAQIAKILRQRWRAYGGSSTRLHRYLRDDALVACEQSRFRALWREVRAEFDAGRKESGHGA